MVSAREEEAGADAAGWRCCFCRGPKAGKEWTWAKQEKKSPLFVERNDVYKGCGTDVVGCPQRTSRTLVWLEPSGGWREA